MKASCTILIFHYESFEFLCGCMSQIKRFTHPDIDQHIIIADQSGVYTHRKVHYTFSSVENVTVIRMPQLDSGYAVDCVFRNMNIQTEYFCTLDCDAFPISNNWLRTPIELIKEYGYSFVGGHAGIDDVYKEHGEMFCMNQFYRVGTTEMYKKLSMEAGFVRFTDRDIAGFNYAETGWEGYADCGVVAHWHEDKTTCNNKLGLAIKKKIGIANGHRIGVIVDDLVFHLGHSYNRLNIQDPNQVLGDTYMGWIKKIEQDGLTKKTINELVAQASDVKAQWYRTVWNGTEKTRSIADEALNAKIEKLKKS